MFNVDIVTILKLNTPYIADLIYMDIFNLNISY